MTRLRRSSRDDRENGNSFITAIYRKRLTVVYGIFAGVWFSCKGPVNNGHLQQTITPGSTILNKVGPGSGVGFPGRCTGEQRSKRGLSQVRKPFVFPGAGHQAFLPRGYRSLLLFYPKAGAILFYSLVLTRCSRSG